MHKSNEEFKEKIINKYSKDINNIYNIRDYIISLAIEGKELDSIEFASKIENTFISYSNITFIIGGSAGLSNEIKDKSNMLLSFSKFTFPHQLFRIILLEQLYRAFKINNNEEYHK